MTAYILLLLLTAIIAYCFGSMSTTVLASNFVFRRNLKKLGEGNLGLSNFRRVYGVPGFIKLLLVELVKDLIPLIIGGLLLGIKEHAAVGRAFAGFCLVLGRLYPAFYGFKGSHATACLIIAAIVIDRSVGITSLIFLVGGIALSKYVSLGTVISAVIFIAVSMLQVEDNTAMLLCVLTGAIVLIRHIPAISRIINHRETKLSLEKDISYKFDEKF